MIKRRGLKAESDKWYDWAADGSDSKPGDHSKNGEGGGSGRKRPGGGGGLRIVEGGSAAQNRQSNIVFG